MTILGFQIVLLDEHGIEVERIHDVYHDDTWIVIGDHGYAYERSAEEDGQRVRYFRRLAVSSAGRRSISEPS